MANRRPPTGLETSDYRRLAMMSTQIVSHSGRLPDGRFVNPVFRKKSRPFGTLNEVPVNFTWPLRGGDGKFIFTKCQQCKHRRHPLVHCRLGHTRVLKSMGTGGRARDPNILSRINADELIIHAPTRHASVDTVNELFCKWANDPTARYTYCKTRVDEVLKYPPKSEQTENRMYPIHNQTSDAKLLQTDGPGCSQWVEF